MADYTQAAYDEGVALAASAAKSEGVAEGIAAANVRINAILDSDAGKARPNAALNAALKTTMSAEEATAFLATLPEETKADAGVGAPAGMLKAAMKNGGAGVSTGDDDDTHEPSRAEQTRAMFGAKV